MTNKGEITTNICVLGTVYKIIKGTKEQYPVLGNIDGFTDTSTKEIIIDTFEVTPNSKKDLDKYEKSVMRHEIIHAFLAESGLEANSNSCDAWATNEEMVDWFAIQAPKIYVAFVDAGCL